MSKQAVINNFYKTFREKNIDYLKMINILIENMSEAKLKSVINQLEEAK